MISHQSDLLLFNRAVAYHPKPEVWLLKTEFCAQETIGKLIEDAVNSFPKQPLDEWIVDYPQQTILSTIHLILTHEINEMLHEMGLKRGSEDLSMTQSEVTETFRVNNSNQINTRSNNQLQDVSKITDNLNNSQFPINESKNEDREEIDEEENMSEESDENIEREGEKEENNGEIQNESQHFKVIKSSEDRLEFIKRQEKAKQMELAVKQQEEKEQYINDMFGVNFNIMKITEGIVNIKSLKAQQFKEEAMKALQEKSFQGLYLRLQFWINQIYKRLSTIPEGSSLKLYKTHKMIMKTIICFLSYMRDVVMELRQKEVNDYESYEWQKQIRLTWNASEPACKVECGGWSSYQGNEYLGSKIRLPITPLTNRYFVFCSAALREKSAIIFKTIPAQGQANEIFEEYASICTVGLHTVHLTDNPSMSQLKI